MKLRVWAVALYLLIISIGCNELYAQLVYNVEVELKDAELNVSCTIAKRGDTEIDYFIFDKDVSIDRILVDGEILANDYKPESDTIKLACSVKKEIAFFYKIIIDTNVNEPIYLNRTSKWIPFKYDVISPLSLVVKTPSKMQAISSNIKNSRRIEDSLVFEYVNEHNTHFPLILLCSNNFVSECVNKNGCVFQFYYPKEKASYIPRLKEEVINTYTWTAKYMKNSFSKNLTIVCVDNIGFVQSLNQLMVVGTDYLGYLDYPEMSFWPSHEVIHQWIGSGYNIYLKRNNEGRWFLEESLTEYLRYIYLEHCYGLDTLKSLLGKCMLEYHNKIKNTPLDRPVWDAGPDRLTYGVAPLFYHYLRVEMGDEKWNKFVSEVYCKHYGKFIDSEIFFQHLNRYMDSERFMHYYNWLKVKGVPDDISNFVN
jgi:hypothetical protein